MRPIQVWTLQKNNIKMILNGLPNPDTFWIEVFDNDVLIKESEKVFDWGEDVYALLNAYDWSTYETIQVNPDFTMLISNFRIETNNFIKPNSRVRILELLNRFTQGEVVHIKRTAFEFGVGEAEIKKDIKILRDFLARENKGIKYIRNSNMYSICDIEDRT